MQDKNETRLPTSAGGEKGFTLGHYMKWVAVFYAIVVILFVAIEVVAIRHKIAAGAFQPMSHSNLNVVGEALGIISLLALLLGCGYAFLLLANTRFDSWGIRRPSWPFAHSVPWTAITRVTPDPLGLKFHTKNKVLIYPFRIFDSVPPLLLDLLSQHVSKSALAGLNPGDFPGRRSE
jgi:hypothetical protein